MSPFQVQSSLDQLYSAMEALVRQRSADVQLVNSYLGRWERNIWSRFGILVGTFSCMVLGLFLVCFLYVDM
jgi:hypothetical protein